MNMENEKTIKMDLGINLVILRLTLIVDCTILAKISKKLITTGHTQNDLETRQIPWALNRQPQLYAPKYTEKEYISRSKQS